MAIHPLSLSLSKATRIRCGRVSHSPRLTSRACPRNGAVQFFGPERSGRETVMKIRNSLKSLKGRHRDNRVIRRRGRTYVINKTNRRFKARQG